MFLKTGKNFGLTFRKKDTLLAGIPFLVLLLWFGLKSLQVESPNQSIADAHIALQLSKGWLEGRPLLYDTYYGYHDKIHNYFFILLLAPFTWLMGVKGLFLIYVLLTAFLYLLIGKTIAFRTDRNNLWISLILLGLGPFAYFVFIDVFGWHPEQYYFPLMGLSSFFLARKKWFPAFVFIVLTASVKESAPILLCGLLLFVSLTESVIENNTDSRAHLLFSKRNLLIIGVSLVFFVLGMAWLSFRSNGPSRLTIALRVLSGVPPSELLIYLSKFGVSLVITFSTLFLPFVPIIRKIHRGSLLTFFIAFYFLVLCTAFFVEGLMYFPDFDAGLPYPTRAGSMLAFFFSCYVYLVVRNDFAFSQTAVSFSLISAVLQITFSSVLVFHSWPLIETRKDLGKMFFYLVSPEREDPYDDTDRQLLKKIAAKLPRGAEIVAPEKYLSIFHQFYGARIERQQWLLGQPILYVCDQNRSQNTPIDCGVPDSNYRLHKGKNIHIWIIESWENQLMKSPD